MVFEDQFIRSFIVNTRREEYLISKWEVNFTNQSADRAKSLVSMSHYVNSIAPIVISLIGILINTFRLLVYTQYNIKERNIFFKLSVQLAVNNISILSIYLVNFISLNNSSLVAYSSTSCKFMSFAFHWLTAYQAWAVVVYLRAMEDIFTVYDTTENRPVFISSSIARNQSRFASFWSIFFSSRNLTFFFFATGLIYLVDLKYVDVVEVEYGESNEKLRMCSLAPEYTREFQLVIIVLKHSLDILVTLVLPIILISIKSLNLMKASARFALRVRLVRPIHHRRKLSRLRQTFTVLPFSLPLCQIPVVIMTVLSYVYFSHNSENNSPDSVVWKLKLKMLYTSAILVKYSCYIGIVLLNMCYNSVFKRKLATLFQSILIKF